MELDFLTIESITSGAVRVTKENDGYHFYRFTPEQEALYAQIKPEHNIKVLCTSGVKMMFRTNTKKIQFDVLTVRGTGRSYFSFDVYVNGQLYDTLDNFRGKPIPREYTTAEFPLGEYKKEFEFPEGDKEITIYFPWSACAILQKFSVDDGAYVIPVKNTRKLLCFGDSITQGYDAFYPSQKYTTAIAAALDAEEINKAIGGDRFFPELVATKDSFEPDIITVAYGTNDWRHSSKEMLAADSKAFYKNLRQTYPNAQIFALTPIWRKTSDQTMEAGTFFEVADMICDAAGALENVTVISCFDFVPHEAKYFADETLHPNDRGFSEYFKALLPQIKKDLQ